MHGNKAIAAGIERKHIRVTQDFIENKDIRVPATQLMQPYNGRVKRTIAP
jgi:hypothetical protein